MNGLLVAVEGPKSVGKSTLIERLKDIGETTDWLFTKEPTDTFDLSNEERLVGIRLAELIANDRARHIRDVIKPALDAGRVVITDRYILSSFVFHCLDGVDASDIAALNDTFPHPDVLVLIQCSPIMLKNRRHDSTLTRLSNTIPVADELLGYLTYTPKCRPISGEIFVGYNDTMSDCHMIARRLIDTIQSKRRADA
jgi:dTMP kinase